MRHVDYDQKKKIVLNFLLKGWSGFRLKLLRVYREVAAMWQGLDGTRVFHLIVRNVRDFVKNQKTQKRAVILLKRGENRRVSPFYGQVVSLERAN